MIDYNILFATTNGVKLSEVKAITDEFNEKLFNPKGINIIIKSLLDISFNIHKTPNETGKNYLENAKIKAEFYDILLKNDGVNAILSDDAGYEVEDWNNLPGLYSHRLINIYTVDRLRNASKAFQCCAMYMITDGTYTANNKCPFEVYHRVSGTMLRETYGDYGSYYMNAFQPDNQKKRDLNRKTFSELGFDYICKYSARAFCLSEIYAMLIDSMIYGCLNN